MKFFDSSVQCIYIIKIRETKDVLELIIKWKNILFSEFSTGSLARGLIINSKHIIIITLGKILFMYNNN